MTALSVFDYAGQQVRTVIRDGEPWFVAADVCRILDIGNSRDALARLDPDEKGVATTDTPGGAQQVATVNEPGLYTLVLTSRKPEAKSFKRWITHEVLPAIRQTGHYNTPAFNPAEVTRADMARMILAAEEELTIANKIIDTLEPLATSWTKLAEATGDYSVREAAQILSRDGQFTIGQRRLFDALKSAKWISDASHCYQRHIDLGRVRLKTDTYYDPFTGEPHLRQQIRITSKGLGDLHQLLGSGATAMVLPSVTA